MKTPLIIFAVLSAFSFILIALRNAQGAKRIELFLFYLVVMTCLVITLLLNIGLYVIAIIAFLGGYLGFCAVTKEYEADGIILGALANSSVILFQLSGYSSHFIFWEIVLFYGSLCVLGFFIREVVVQNGKARMLSP